MSLWCFARRRGREEGEGQRGEEAGSRARYDRKNRKGHAPLHSSQYKVLLTQSDALHAHNGRWLAHQDALERENGKREDRMDRFLLPIDDCM